MESLLFALNMTWKIVFIIFFFGFCIFIHEFGHLLAALWQGLHVEKFSIGFGKKLFGFRYKGVEFVVSMLPFGGYVSLPQLDPSDQPVTSDNKPLEPGKPWPRAVTAFAGPLFNIIFGFVLATIMWAVGVWEAPPSNSCIVTAVPQALPLYKDGLKLTDEIVAFDGKATNKYLEELCEEIDPAGGEHTLTVQRGDKTEDITFKPDVNPEWAAGLRKGDRIVAINGKTFKKGREDLVSEYVYNGGPNVTLSLVRGDKSFDITYPPLPNPLMEGLGFPFFSVRNPVAIGGVSKNSPAEKAGLKAGDQLLQLNGRNVVSGEQFTKDLFDLGGKPISILASRGGKEILFEGMTCLEPYGLQSLGIHFSVTVISCMNDMPAYKAGLRRDDRILKVDELEIADSRQLTEYIKKSAGKAMTIVVMRDGKELVIPDLKARKENIKGKDTWIVGVTLGDSSPKVIGHPNPWTQFERIVTQTGRTLGLLFAPITSRIAGHERSKATVKMEHMSGPLGIVMMLWYSLKADGLRGGLSLIILITFSLALMNLLPIPVLDGGHIVFAGIEAVIRRRLPVKLVVILQNLFAILLIGMILYISFFDSRRLFRLFKFGSSKGPQPKVEKAVPGAEASKDEAKETMSAEEGK